MSIPSPEDNWQAIDRASGGYSDPGVSVEDLNKIAAMLAMAMRPAQIAPAVGLTTDRYRSLMSRAKANWDDWATYGGGDIENAPPIVQFYQACASQKAGAVYKMRRKVYEAGEGGDWRAADTFLKNTDPEAWGRVESDKQLSRLRKQLSTCSDEELLALIDGRHHFESDNESDPYAGSGEDQGRAAGGEA